MPVAACDVAHQLVGLAIELFVALPESAVLDDGNDEKERDDQLKVVSNGKQYSTPEFRTLYENLIGVLRSGTTNVKPTGEPILTIDLKTNLSLAETSWIKLYQESAGKYAVLHDTGELYQVDAKDMEIFLNNYRRFLNGEAFE